MNFTAKWVAAETSAHGMHPRQGGFVVIRRTGTNLTDVPLLLQRLADNGIQVRHAWGDSDSVQFTLSREPTAEQLKAVCA